MSRTEGHAKILPESTKSYCALSTKSRDKTSDACQTVHTQKRTGSKIFLAMSSVRRTQALDLGSFALFLLTLVTLYVFIL